MEVRIEELPQTLLVGKSLRMSLVNNKTSTLWRSFMTEKSVITNAVGTDLYSIQVYDEIQYFKNFNPETEFTKWVAIAVENQSEIPNEFSPFTIESGLYAVFQHKGAISEFARTIAYIFSQWLPKSEYELDDRPHFELLGKKYKNNSPDSEEEVWIPIKKKA